MIAVLRLGHRINRDQRMTTHVALVARAFGAQQISIPTKDVKLEQTIQSVCKRFGGSFTIMTGVDPKRFLKQWEGTIVHLTMYGEPLDQVVSRINRRKDLLIIVGAEKVPGYCYQVADYNVAVGNQPHSEVAALALFLDRYTNAGWMRQSFLGELKIVPTTRGKTVVTRTKRRSRR